MRLAVTDPTARFKLRVAGVVIHSGRILLHRFEHDPFWALPGGTGELLETTRQTLARELQEEIGAQARVGRLLWVVENFFRYAQHDHHELGFYYRCSLPDTFHWEQTGDRFEGLEIYEDQSRVLRLIYEWFPLDAVKTLPLYPQFLRAGLLRLPRAVTHVVIHEPGTDVLPSAGSENP